ncbi:MAG TPA: hypothetical protein VHC69_30145 [Polyangiaceae bacterium]|nr:hypothetical protein [Polyangiaceae bacterium]
MPILEAAGAESVRDDERGAIMVLGIFMCSCIVGVLWYIAGIGDAIIFRERMQEAADAVAFSGATLHARGMNLIVLINLLMAVILAVRVALKMLILALTIATVVFEAIGDIPICCQWALVVAGFTGEAAGDLQSALGEIDPLIDEALEALHGVEGVIARIVPPAASLGAVQVGEKYKPPVTVPVGTDLDEITSGLPVVDGSEDMLCRKAGEAVAMVIAWPLSKVHLGQGASLFKGMLSSITEAGSGYFCEMGSGGQAPDLDSIYSDNAKQVCDKKQSNNQQQYDDASAKWHQACDATNPPATCMDPDPLGDDKTSMSYDDKKLTLSQINNLKSLENDVDHWHGEVENFDDDQCNKDQKQQMKQQTQTQQGNQNNGNNSNKTPKKVDPNWKNGVQNAQFMSLIEGDTSTLKIGPRGVKVGAFKDHRVNDPQEPLSAKSSFAQAEFFYDCSGDWDSSSCNNEDETHESAMWHFRWRARLRRYTEPNTIAKAVTIGALADFGNQFRRFPLYSTDIGNEQLRLKLQQVALAGVSDTKEMLILH